MAEKFNTRDVSKKEIYDSYMGILRISPNEISGVEVDDATPLLNTLYNEDKNERTKILLSDSDGNYLPITFQPRAFQTSVIKRDLKTSIDTSREVDVLNVATLIGQSGGTEGKAVLFVSNTLKCRSTLLLSRNDDESFQEMRHSNIRILSGGKSISSSNDISGRGWLLYPTESPNDANYFNNKNCHNLFDAKDTSTPRHVQVENNLYNWSRKNHNKISVAERVHTGGKSITQINAYNEEVPLYYTRDYILGHYDSHQLRTGMKNNTVNSSWGIDGESNEGKTDYITKLSWTRIDELIWDSLNEILTGQVRHTKGRYDGLGTLESAEPGIRDKLGFGTGHEYKKFAPILGTETTRGTITYHAMPFHRYWFHRTKQALRAFIERKKEELTLDNVEGNLDEIVLSNGLNGGSYQKGNFQADEIETLESYYKNGLLTPASMGTKGFASSLAKNYILCNGCYINFQNFPNISLTNDLIFDTSQKDENGNVLKDEFGNIIKGGIANCKNVNEDDENDKTKEFIHNSTTDNNILGAITQSMGGAKLPNLFALYEKTPRFIRGLNWGISKNNEDKIVNVYDESDPSDYVSMIDSDKRDENPSPMQTVQEEDNILSVSKPIYNVAKLYFHTFDHLEEKETHQHLLFSEIKGGSSGYNNELIYQYHCDNTRGGHNDHKFKWAYARMNTFDRTYSNTQLVQDTGSSSESKFKFYGSEWNDGGTDNSWLKYCGGKVYEGGFYTKYTPIPNLGLYLFNSSIFNNHGGTEYIGTERGTATYNAPQDEKTQVQNNIENPTTDGERIYYKDAEGKEHYLKDEAPISDEYKYQSTDQLTEDERIQLTKDLKKHDEEKQRRKFYAMKMNEAEGFIPISVAGKASGYVELAWSRDERSGSKSSSRNTYHDVKKNVASYIMTPLPNPNPNDKDEYNKVQWRCWSSIAYTNANKLGVGDVKGYIDNKANYTENSDYYDTNCVTQLTKDEKFKTYNYGGVKIEVDETCPSPTYMNLLPLIRI